MSTIYCIACLCAVLIISLKSVLVDGQRLSDDLAACFCLSFFVLVAVLITTWNVWKLLSDPLLGEVSINIQGLTFYTRNTTYSFPFSECKSMGFISRPGTIYSKEQYVRFIYLSKVLITSEQKAHLFEGRSTWRRGKRNMPLYRSEYVLFQFDADIFAEFISYVPEPFHAKLINELGWDDI